MGEWVDTKLGAFVKSISDTYKFAPNEKVIFLNTSDIYQGRVLNHTLEDARKLPGQAKKKIRKGDFLFSEIRPANGRYALVDFDAEKHVVSTKLMVLRCNENIDVSYFRLFLTSKETLDYLQMIAEDRSGTFPQITFDHISTLDIALPRLLSEQKAIASVLSSLDDKIDLLHRQNKTLEAMAETLFRQWFVVEAQDDWDYDEIKKYVTVVDNRGKTPPNDVIETEYPLIEANALNGDDRLINYAVIKKYVSEETFNNWFRNNLIKNETIITTVGANIGAMAMFVVEKGNIAQNIIGLAANKISPFYLYQILKYKKDEILQLDIGGVQPSLKVPHLLSLEIPIPPVVLQKKFDNQLTKFVSKMEINYKNIRTLEKLRDTLLPKLMSGEVRVEYES